MLRQCAPIAPSVALHFLSPCAEHEPQPSRACLALAQPFDASCRLQLPFLQVLRAGLGHVPKLSNHNLVLCAALLQVSATPLWQDACHKSLHSGPLRVAHILTARRCCNPCIGDGRCVQQALATSADASAYLVELSAQLL